MATTTKLEVTVLSDLEVQMKRVFDAPRDLVFEAHTSCEHVSRWWGRRGSTLSVCEMDFRPGGKWRFVERHGDEEFGFRGEYLEIARPERIVQTFEFEGMEGHIVTDTLTLSEQDGKTLAITVSRFATKEDRDGMLESGMEDGAGETWDRLDEYLQTLKK